MRTPVGSTLYVIFAGSHIDLKNLRQSSQCPRTGNKSNERTQLDKTSSQATLVAAPPALLTAAHTFLRCRMHFAATSLDSVDVKTRITRALYAVLPNTALLSLRSFKSNLRRCVDVRRVWQANVQQSACGRGALHMKTQTKRKTQKP